MYYLLKLHGCQIRAEKKRGGKNQTNKSSSEFLSESWMVSGLLKFGFSDSFTTVISCCIGQITFLDAQQGFFKLRHTCQVKLEVGCKGKDVM